MIVGVLGVAGISGVIPGWMPGKAPNARQNAPAREPTRMTVQPSNCALCGTVESIRTVELRSVPDAAGRGGAGGADAGRTGQESSATTILESVAEAITGGGREGEKNPSKRFAYRVTVRMDDGSYRTVSQSTPPALAVGDKVRVVEGRLVRT